MGAAKMNPRDSMPTTTSIFFPPIFARRPSIAAANESPSLRSVVMSLNRIPGFGKSGTSRILLARSFVCTATGLESTVRAAVKLDVHTHYYPPAYFERIERAGGEFSFGTSPTGQRIIRYKGARFFGVTAPMTDVGQRLEDMDRVGIDVEVLSLSTPNVFFAEGRAQTDVARMVNDAYADLIAKRPGRFLGFASIPMDDPDGPLRELARAMDELHLQGVVLLSNIRGRALADAVYRPFFE